MSGAVAALVTHWGRREGGAELWARVSWLAVSAPLWLLAQDQDAGQRKEASLKEGEWGARLVGGFRVLRNPEAGSLFLPCPAWLPVCRADFLVLDTGRSHLKVAALLFVGVGGTSHSGCLSGGQEVSP